MRTFRIPFQAMAGACEIVIAVDTEQQAAELAKAAIDEVLRVQAKFSRYQSSSIVSQINAAAGKAAVQCDAETWSLLEYADSLHKTSGGLFDITSGVLRQAWNFKLPQLPAPAELERLLALMGWTRVEREAQQVYLPQTGMEIDFGGFGKEYAADRAGVLLAAKGVKNGYVNLAGDMRVLGPKPDGQAWMIGIQDPRHKDRVLATIPVHQGGLATSGDYERFFEIDGQRYCHILNPRTGQPVRHWQTVSVVAPLAVIAGNCTTIAMLKESAGLAFLASCGMSYLAVDQSGTIHQSAAQES